MNNNTNIEQIELHKHMTEAYLAYSMSVIVDRALPDVRDGCLPIHRRILYAMHNKSIDYRKPFAKSSEPVSETMKIHAHGDSSIYTSLALLTDRNESLLHPFLEGDGSFGKAYSTDSPSHMRYTFCRLNKFSDEMFKGLKKGAVKLIGEDGHYQPLVLPNTYPNILVKPNNAIAVGEACNFGSFPLHEVCDLTTAYIDNKDLDVTDYITPDFSTGAELIYSKAQLRTIYETGKGKIKLRSKYRFVEEDNIIEVYEIPYSTTAQKVISEIMDKMPKLKEITDVRDETGFNQEREVEELKISIDVKKNTNIEVLMAKLFKETSLETSFSFNMNCLVNNRPKVLGIKPILDEWLKFRREVIVNVMQYDIRKQTQELHLLLGLEKILLDIEKTIDIIRNSAEDIIIGKLMFEFDIDKEQAEHVANMKLRNINKDYITKQIKDIQDMKDALEVLKANSQDEQYINAKIKEELQRVKNTYGQPRRTEIVYEDTFASINTAKKIVEDYTATNVLTKEMYYKKCRRYADADKQRVKDGDEVIAIEQCSNTGKVIFITNKGNGYMVNIDDMEEKTQSSMGVYLPSILPLETEEIIIGMIATDNYKGYALIMYDNAKLAKIEMSSFKTKCNVKKLKNSLSLESPVVYIGQSNNDIELLIEDCYNKTKIINTKDINSKKSRNTVGVRTWHSKKPNWRIISAKPIKKDGKNE